MRFFQVALTILAAVLAVQGAGASSRLGDIKSRGFVSCGVWPHVAGFSEVDSQGRYSGLDVDICRALAAGILGAPDKVHFTDTETVDAFIRDDGIDLVSRRLSWELRREGALGLLFGPVTFYDGQGFLVPKSSGAKAIADVAATKICVEPRTVAEVNLVSYFHTRKLPLKEIQVTAMADVEKMFAAGKCDSYTTDVSELAAIRAGMSRPGDFAILAEQISKEPLAQLVRQGDDRFFDVLRWTVFALIEAEELGITSQNVDAMLKSDDAAVKRLLGVIPGNGKALGLSEDWAYRIVKTLGNYGEIYDRDVGLGSRIKLDRGLNRLWTDGGLIYAPPLR